MSPRFLKDGTEVLAKPICDIIILSIKLSTFPDKCKIAKLTPLFKKGSKTVPKNCRLISLFPLISKVIEKAIHLQTQEYLDKNGLFINFNQVLGKNFSTDSCLVQLTDYIFKDMDKGQPTGMILIDLQKAFDTLDHNVLLKKLICVGFKKTVTKWFKSYLSNRKFFVSIEVVFSEEGLLTCGPLQGSILGPLLFLIYINDLPQSLNETASNLYADDTCVYYQRRDKKKIENNLNKEFSSLCEWFIDNKLSIPFGEDKTKAILFTILFIWYCLDLSLRTHISAIHFNKINWLPVEHRVETCTRTTVFKFWNQLTPFCFEDIFKPSFNKYNTKPQLALDIPLRKTTIGKKSISFLGPKLWSKTNYSLKAAKATVTFTHTLKKHGPESLIIRILFFY